MRMVTSLVLLQGAGQGATSGLMGSAIPYDATGFRAFGHWAKKYGGTFWGLEGTADGRKEWEGRDNINDSVPGAGFFTFENYGGGAHCCWNTFYNPSIIDWQCVAPVTNPNIAINTLHANSMGSYKKGSSLFQWMLRQGDTTLVGGTVSNQSPIVNAGSDKTIYLPISSVNISGSVIDEGGSLTYLWSKISGNGGGFSSISNSSTTVTGLTQGMYIFQLSVTDTGGLTGVDQITVTVQPDTTTYENTFIGNRPLVGNGEYQDLFIETQSAFMGVRKFVKYSNT